MISAMMISEEESFKFRKLMNMPEIEPNGKRPPTLKRQIVLNNPYNHLPEY